MHRIPIGTPDAAPEDVRELLRAASPGREQPLNIHAQMAYAPVVLAAYMGIRGALAERGTLNARTRSAITLTVARVDASAYAEAVNANLARRAGWANADVDAMRTGVVVDQHLDSLLAVVREAAARKGRVIHATWQAARDAGWSSAQLAEAFASIGLALFVDYFLNYAATEFDVPAPPTLAPENGATHA
jgi:alkylhydroperoxidase family enzyme